MNRHHEKFEWQKFHDGIANKSSLNSTLAFGTHRAFLLENDFEDELGFELVDDVTDESPLENTDQRKRGNWTHGGNGKHERDSADFAALIYDGDETETKSEGPIDASTEVGASHVADILFERNSYDLNKNAHQSLARMLSDVRGSGQIDDVKVLAWADSDTALQPHKRQRKPSRTEKQLAEQRASHLCDFLKLNLHVEVIDVYNMAEHPDSVELLSESSDARLLRAMEVAGLPTKETSSSVMIEAQSCARKPFISKASHAVVMIMLKDLH